MNKKFKVFLIVILILIITGSAIAFVMWNRPERKVENEKGIEVTSVQLVKDYQANEAEANKKYLDKAIQVTGTVSEVKNNQDGKPTIMLTSDDAFTGVFCTLKEDASVTAGSVVTIKGLCSGMLSDVSPERSCSRKIMNSLTKLMRKPIVLLSMLLIIFYACKHEVGVPVTPIPGGTDTTGTGGNPGGGTNGGSDSICFEGDILPIFTSNCAKSGCHDVTSSQDGYILNSYNNIINSNRNGIKPGDLDHSKIYDAITEDNVQKRMPQGQPPLSDTQIALIRRWILEGAKNTANCTTTCNANIFTWSGGVKPIIDKYCKGCHSGAAASGGLNYSTYAGVQAVALNGKLIGAINHAAGFSPMPKGGAKLSDCNISQITNWVNDGAPNN